MMPDSDSLWLIHDVCPHCQIALIRWEGKDVRYHGRIGREAFCNVATYLKQRSKIFKYVFEIKTFHFSFE